MQNKYLFTSKRLGFRNWLPTDLAAFTALNTDPTVMQFFPETLSAAESNSFFERLQKHYLKHNYCYFAAETLDKKEFIGFIGLAFQTYQSTFTPATDIGWRLHKKYWNKGYATEGAKQCLKYAFEVLQLNTVIATCTLQNYASEKVMQKIGMQKVSVFKHPNLKMYPSYENCVLYKIKHMNQGCKITFA